MTIKKMTQILGILGVIVALAPVAGYANEGKHDGPCKKIKAACEAAGFKKGAHKEHKGLYKDCMKKIMSGEAVTGVTIDPTDLSACQEKRAKRKEKHKE